MFWLGPDVNNLAIFRKENMRNVLSNKFTSEVDIFKQEQCVNIYHKSERTMTAETKSPEWIQVNVAQCMELKKGFYVGWVLRRHGQV